MSTPPPTGEHPYSMVSREGVVCQSPSHADPWRDGAPGRSFALIEGAMKTEDRWKVVESIPLLMRTLDWVRLRKDTSRMK